MVRRSIEIALCALAFVLLGVSHAAAAPAPPPVPEPAADTGDGSSSLIPIPPGCPSPDPADVAFVGTVLDKDEFIEKGTVRFQIDQLRAGNATPYSVRGVIDVRYGPDSQYLDIESQYLVAAAVNPETGVLSSRVSAETPLFGGDAVIGLEDTEVVCPIVDDPVQTINVDGTPIDAGLFAPFFEDRRVLLAAIGVPAGIVALALIGLVLLRRLLDIGFRGIVALGRAAVLPTRDHRAAQVRRHANPLEADYTHWDELDDEHDDGADDEGLTDDDSNLVDAELTR